MKIGLMGVPGSGKTNLAVGLEEALNLQVIDNYAEVVAEEFDWALGRYASYVGNIAVALERYKQERPHEERVSCGTALDTVTYLAVHQFIAPDIIDMRRQSGGLVVLGCIAQDMMAYDHIFYLPSATADDYLSTLGQGLEEAIPIFESPVTTLEDPATHLQDVLAAIDAKRTMDEATKVE